MKNKKIFILVFCILLIVVFTVRTTYAFFTDRSEKKNVYSVGKVEIEMDEKQVDELGNPTNDEKRVVENKYHLIPGHTYTKDPTIRVVAGSNDAYVRILVSVNMISELNEMFNNDFKLEYFVNGLNSSIWNCSSIIENDNTNIYEFRYYKKVNGYENGVSVEKQLEPLFNTFKVPENLTIEQLKALENLEIKIVGNAVQAEGFSDEEAAWEAFELQIGK